MPTKEEFQLLLSREPHYHDADERLNVIITHYSSYKRLYYEFVQKLLDNGFERHGNRFDKGDYFFGIRDDLMIRFNYKKTSAGTLPIEFLNLHFDEFLAM